MYLVESGTLTSEFIDALTDAAKRDVRIWIIFDSFGARELNDTDRSQLTGEPNIAIAYYHPIRWARLRANLVRDHRKLLIADGIRGYTGGVGLSDGIRIDDESPRPWHDIAIEFCGEIVQDWQNLFARQWQQITHTEISIPQCGPKLTHGYSARLVSSQPTRVNAIYGHLRQQITHAQRRIWIATAYFLPSWRLRRVLQQAAERGVDVRLLLPGTITDNPAVRFASRGFYLRLLKSGVKIFEYEPTFMHAKLALVDDWTSTGSSNFDRWSMARNLEANQEIFSPQFAAELQQMLHKDLLDSAEITLKDWRNRPRGQRWREQVWGIVESWFDR
jgi:cardiolipin synthase